MKGTTSIHRLLRALASDRLAEVGPREHIVLEQLLRRTDLSVSELRASIASAIARDRDEWQRIVERFDQVYLGGGAEPALSQSASKQSPIEPALVVGNPPANRPSFYRLSLHAIVRPIKRWALDLPRAWLAVLLAGLLAMTVLMSVALSLLFFGSNETSEGVDLTAVNDMPLSALEAQAPALVLLEGPRRQHAGPHSWRPDPPPKPLLISLSVLSLLLIALGLRLLLLPGVATGVRLQQARVQAHRYQSALHLTEERLVRTGAANRVEYFVESRPAITQQAILDSAEQLGRIWRLEQGAELDTASTVTKTLHAGGQFTPVRAPYARRMEVVLLLDIEDGDHPWLGGFRRILDGWRVQGARLLVFEFQRTPSALRHASTRERLNFATLARRTRGLPLIVFSRRLDPSGYLRRAPWLIHLPGWPLIAWIDPDPRSRDELPADRMHAIADLRARGVRQFALSDDGIRRMAMWLASEGEASVSVTEWCPLSPPPGVDAQVDQALQKWAVAACMVPDPNWDQLEAIRTHCADDIGRWLPHRQDIQRLLEWVAWESGNPNPDRLHNGACLEIAPALVERWLCRERAEAESRPDGSSFERRVHELLIQQLEGTRGRSAYAERRRSMKLAIHQAQIEPEKALDHLAWVFDDEGAADVASETLAWLEGELDRRDAGFGVPFAVAAREYFARLSGRSGGLGLGEWLYGHYRVWLGVAVCCALLGAFVWWLGAPAVKALPARFERTIAGTDVRLPATWILKETGHSGTTSLLAIEVLPSGIFQMGSVSVEKGRFDNETAHDVSITRPFAIGRSEVTQGQYKAVLGDQALDNACLADVGLDDALPVVCVSWHEAVQFANALSEAENLPAAYRIAGEQITLTSGTGYRLPTEAEWEYAARGGAQTTYVGTDEDEAVCEYGNVAGPDVAVLFGATIGRSEHEYFSCRDGYPGARLAPAGEAGGFKANAWQLSDLGGNASEWVWDWYEPFDRRSRADPGGPASGSLRVIRGASWYRLRRYARVAYRSRLDPAERRNFVGFRLARSCAPGADSVVNCFIQQASDDSGIKP